MQVTLSRRQLLSSIPPVAVLGTAGCTEVDEEEVEVVYRRPAELTDPGTEPVEVEVLVHNIGVASDIEITVEAVGYQEDVVASTSTVEPFDRDEQRLVSLELTPGPDANIIFAEATVV